LTQAVVLDADFLSSFLKIDSLDLVRDFYQVETLQSIGIPTFLLACKRTLLIDSQAIAALVHALEEKDRYRFRKDVLDLLLS
jgi:hypothetical protein